MSSSPAASSVPQPRPAAAPGTGQAPAITRQMVSFTFYKLDPAFRRLPADQREQARVEFLAWANERRAGLICLTYSTVGLKADSDLVYWRISASSDDLQRHEAGLNRTELGGYLHNTRRFLSMTKRSMYIDKLDPFHTAESRTHLYPGKRKYLFVYPFVKSREWYMLSMEQRQRMMDTHIEVGNKFPSVKLNTTYSFGLDDQDFVVAFETEEPKDFLDLVMALRETEASKYTVRDTPMYTCVQKPMDQILGELF